MTTTGQLDMFGRSYTGGKQADLFVHPVKRVTDDPTIGRQANRTGPNLEDLDRPATVEPPEDESLNLEALSASADVDDDLDDLDESIPIPEGRWTDTGDYLIGSETKPAYRMSLEEFIESTRREYPKGKLPNGMTTSAEDCRVMWEGCCHANRVVLAREKRNGRVCSTCGDGLPPRATVCPNCYTQIGKGKEEGYGKA